MTPTDLRVLLLQRGVTQAQIARELSVSRALVSGVIAGHRRTPRIRRAIAARLRLSYAGVWGEEDPGTDVLPPGRPAVIRKHVDANPAGES